MSASPADNCSSLNDLPPNLLEAKHRGFVRWRLLAWRRHAATLFDLSSYTRTEASMSAVRGSSKTDSASARRESGVAAERIDAVCRSTVAGKLAARDLANWVRAFEVSEGEFRLLWLLFRDGTHPLGRPELDQMELAERLAVSAAQLSGAVERLQARQLIASVRDSSDRRRQLWRLADAGLALVHDVVASVEGRRDCRGLIPPLAPPFEGGGLKREAAA